MAFITVDEAIEEIKNGKMIVIVDDEDRENEGDLVFAGAFCDVEKVNFAITHAKGVLCTPISKEIASRLNFYPMISHNTSAHNTAFTISVDAKAALTGVSAIERDMTIKLIANPASTSKEFVAPGHIFPLIAKDGGVLERLGHTEGSIDLCKMAGLAPIAVICEIVNEDGTMARRDDLELFCKKFGISMISIAQLVEYRLKNETLISFSPKKSGLIAGVGAQYYDITDHRGNLHKAFIFGTPKDVCNVKFHKVGKDVDFLTSDGYVDFIESLKELSKDGGILILLDNMLDIDDRSTIKEYGIGAQILVHLNVKKIKLITSNTQKEFSGLSGFGLDIVN